jgi:hypothetical protein
MSLLRTATATLFSAASADRSTVHAICTWGLQSKDNAGNFYGLGPYNLRVARAGYTCGLTAFARPLQRCICMLIGAGDGIIMFWLMSTMIHMVPATTTKTMRTPKASASTLLVLSGPLVMCRKNTR